MWNSKHHRLVFDVNIYSMLLVYYPLVRDLYLLPEGVINGIVWKWWINLKDYDLGYAYAGNKRGNLGYVFVHMIL